MATSTFNRLVQEIREVDDLRIFMGLHVYAVWDFMHLLKGLQRSVGEHYPELNKQVDELIREEEIDHVPSELGGPAELSHFEIYVRAMREIGTPTGEDPMESRYERMQGCCLSDILADPMVPEASREFMQITQEILEDGHPEVVQVLHLRSCCLYQTYSKIKKPATRRRLLQH